MQLLTREGEEAIDALRDVQHRLVMRKCAAVCLRHSQLMSRAVERIAYCKKRKERLFRSERSKATVCGTRKEMNGEVNNRSPLLTPLEDRERERENGWVIGQVEEDI